MRWEDDYVWCCHSYSSNFETHIQFI